MGATYRYLLTAQGVLTVSVRSNFIPLTAGCRAFPVGFLVNKKMAPHGAKFQEAEMVGKSGKAIRGTAHQRAKAVEATQKFEESEVHLEFAASLLQGENALAEPNRHRT